LDLTDLYAFPKPGDTGKSILVMNVHPSVGENPPGPTITEPFAPMALYELKVDTDGDAVADIAYRVCFSSSFQFTGDDFFADIDVCSIVLEVPNSALGPKPVGLWHRTLVRAEGARGGWVQAERGARPAQLFLALGLSETERAAYLTGEPKDDVRFLAAFAHALEHTGGYAPQEAKRVAGIMLPEILFYDPARAASFPENGRALTDDAVDAFLAILTNGKITGDKVGPHKDLLAEFPYLGPPHGVKR